MRTTRKFLICYLLACGAFVAFYIFNKMVCSTMIVYEPEIDPDYQTTERDIEIRNAYSGINSHWCWEEAVLPPELTVGSDAVLGSGMREVERLKAKYPGLH